MIGRPWNRGMSVNFVCVEGVADDDSSSQFEGWKVEPTLLELLGIP